MDEARDSSDDFPCDGEDSPFEVPEVEEYDRDLDFDEPGTDEESSPDADVALRGAKPGAPSPFDEPPR